MHDDRVSARNQGHIDIGQTHANIVRFRINIQSIFDETFD